MKKGKKREILHCEFGSGMFRASVVKRDDKEWFFDGPAGWGPKDVRRSGRGPFWRGAVSSQFVASLRRNAKKRGVPYRCYGERYEVIEEGK